MAAQQTAPLDPLPPGSTIGILGGGQLGRMLAMAAARLGFRCHIYSDVADPPAAHVALDITVGAYEDFEKLSAFAAQVDVITYEFENVPVAAAEKLSELRPVSPPPRALEVAQDRLVEKSFVEKLGVPVAPFLEIPNNAAALAPEDVSAYLPGILKTRRFGYDGKGQARVDTHVQLPPALAQFGDAHLILEKRIPFQSEVSVLVVRGADGATAFYDIPENEHRDGILHRSTVRDAVLPEAVTQLAHDSAARIAEALGYVGVLAVEMFYLGDAGDPPLLVNEIAPRVHNSGHWTMDACHVDQFENHIRAICRWPLGTTHRHRDIEMINLIGTEVHQWQALAAEEGVSLHLYGKREARDGRKMGHLNRSVD